MNIEDVLQKVNEYCNEKSFTEETLTSDFKNNFAKFFSQKYPEETSIEDENVIKDLQFNINSAFNASSKGISLKQSAFTAKEKELLAQIEELKKKSGGGSNIELPDEVKKKLAELDDFKAKLAAGEKKTAIFALAKENIRQDLHEAFDNYAKEFAPDMNAENADQAKKLVERFESIFKSSIGDIRPFKPRESKKRDEEIIESVAKITL